MISFIIPTLNEEKYIGKTLSYISLYKGTHEIIVSDTNSPDKTVEIAKKYTDSIVVHSKEGQKLTIAAGRNLGASKSSGDYLVFIDAEICIVDPNGFFDKAFACFEKDKDLVAITSQLRIFKEVETFLTLIFTVFLVCLIL